MAAARKSAQGAGRLAWARAGAALARLGLVLTAVALGVVLAVVAFSTVWLMQGASDGNLTQSMSLYTWMGAKKMLLAGLVGGIAILGLCVLAHRFGRALEGPRAGKALIVAAFAFQLAMILCLQTRDTYWGDSWMVRDFVAKAVEGGGVKAAFSGPYKTLFYDARLYFSCYPFQATLFWLMYGLRLAFGPYSYMVFQLLSSLATCLGVWSLLELGRLVCPRPGARRVLVVLVAACLPMYWLSTFIYGNALGCGLALAFLALQARAMRAATPKGALAWCAASLPALAAAWCVKATFMLFAIAAVLAWVVLAVLRRSAWGLVGCLAAVLVARAVSGLPFEALRAASGGYEFGEALTTLNHLELGLRMGKGEFYVSVDGGAAEFAPGGWSNHANDVWEFSGEDAQVQNEIAAAALADDLVQFASDPAYALRFFSVKLATEWADPTYQSLYYLSMCGRANGSRPNLADISRPVGTISAVLTFVLDGYQTVVFASAFGFVAWAARRWGRAGCAKGAVAPADALGAQGAGFVAGAGAPGAQAGGPVAQTGAELGQAGAAVCGELGRATGTASDAGAELAQADAAAGEGAFSRSGAYAPNEAVLLLAATFFTGFGCYLLWEAKSVYVLPYAIVVLPLAAAGLDGTLRWAKRRRTSSEG